MLIELSNREKNLRFTELFIMVKLLGGDISKEVITKIFDLYESELYHENYDPSVMQQKALIAQLRQAAVIRQKQELAKKVAEFSPE